jgi:hypothetical protein
MDEKYLERRKRIEQFFVPENLNPDSGKVDISPSGKFRIEINRYFTLPNSWQYSRGIVTNIANNGQVVADIKRNYGQFWHTWLQHPNGNEYLLCGEDYQGYSVLNLNTGNYQAYFPEAGYKGSGFCWAAVYPSPDSLVLAVAGCYWACPYDLVLFDFRSPEVLPYPELERFDALDGFDGWKDNDTVVLIREVPIRKSDGVTYESLSEQEQQGLDNDETLMDYRIETVSFQRPSF